MQKTDFKIQNQNDSTIIQEKNGVPFITFRKLAQAGVIHGFSTRMGGVSRDHLSSLNLSFSRGDSPLYVHENFKRIGEAIGFTPEQLVFSDQQHQTEIRKVTKEDAGKGITRAKDYSCVDGLVTNESGLCLTTFYADCVPLFFYDPVKRVVALAHSGWRGTVAKIGEKMVHLMERDYGCMDYNIIAAIGPSICQNCYEVGRDCYEEFQKNFSQAELEEMLIPKGKGKYQLDLWRANEMILLQAGILKEHLDITDICTCCNPQFLFSHRASHGKRGNLAAFIML